MKKRIFFNKTEDMVYISHLDTIRFFERLFNMADIKIKHSEGFNPRPKLSFGPAISLGMEVYDEPLDIETILDISNEEMLLRLKENTVKGFEIVKIEDIEQRSAIAKDYNFVNYSMYFNKEILYEKMKNILEQDSIIVRKEKDGIIKERDVKEKIKKITYKNMEIELSLEEISTNVFSGYFTENEYDDIKIVRKGYGK